VTSFTFIFINESLILEKSRTLVFLFKKEVLSRLLLSDSAAFCGLLDLAMIVLLEPILYHALMTTSQGDVRNSRRAPVPYCPRLALIPSWLGISFFPKELVRRLRPRGTGCGTQYGLQRSGDRLKLILKIATRAVNFTIDF
jgi:hypothetical protein